MVINTGMRVAYTKPTRAADAAPSSPAPQPTRDRVAIASSRVQAGGGEPTFSAMMQSLITRFLRWLGVVPAAAPAAAPAPAYVMPAPAYAPAPVPAAVPVPAAAPAPAPAPAQQPAHMSVGPVPLEGYDYNKLQDLNHRTVKYLFGRVATHYPLDSVHDKASAEALLNRMVPDFRAAGLEIVGVKGDKIQVKTEIGYEWVDVVRGSGAPNPGWWWGSEGKGTPTPTP